MTRKKVNFETFCFSFPLDRKNERKFTFYVNTKNVSPHVLKVSEISLVLHTCDINDILTHSMKYKNVNNSMKCKIVTFKVNTYTS